MSSQFHLSYEYAEQICELGKRNVELIEGIERLTIAANLPPTFRPFDLLPDELVLRIFKRVLYTESSECNSLGSVSLTNKRFRRISCELIWWAPRLGTLSVDAFISICKIPVCELALSRSHYYDLRREKGGPQAIRNLIGTMGSLTSLWVDPRWLKGKWSGVNLKNLVTMGIPTGDEWYTEGQSSVHEAVTSWFKTHESNLTSLKELTLYVRGEQQQQHQPQEFYGGASLRELLAVIVRLPNLEDLFIMTDSYVDHSSRYQGIYHGNVMQEMRTILLSLSHSLSLSLLNYLNLDKVFIHGKAESYVFQALCSKCIVYVLYAGVGAKSTIDPNTHRQVQQFARNRFTGRVSIVELLDE